MVVDAVLFLQLEYALNPNLPNFEELISKTSPHLKGFQTLLKMQVSAARLDGSRI